MEERQGKGASTIIRARHGVARPGEGG